MKDALLLLSPALTFASMVFGLWIFYLAYVSVWVSRTSGKLAAAPWIVQGAAYLILAIGLSLDILFNVFVASVVFKELPSWNFTFTARCRKWRTDLGYRGRIAAWVCEGWLNPFQEHHC